LKGRKGKDMVKQRGDYGDDILGMLGALNCAVEEMLDESARNAVADCYHHLIGDCDESECGLCEQWLEGTEGERKNSERMACLLCGQMVVGFCGCGFSDQGKGKR